MGHENDPIPELKEWEREADTKRRKFDQDPHPVEILWREKKGDRILEEYRKKLLENEWLNTVRVIKPGKDGLTLGSEELTKVFVELKVAEGYSKNKDPARSDEGEDTARRTFKPEKLIEKVRRGVITGAPGCGKTTLLKYLARKVLKDGEFLPVFLEAKVINEKAFQDAQEDLRELLFNLAIVRPIYLEPWEKENLKRDFYKKLAEGKVFIFLDGLDEISAERFSAKLQQAIDQFLESECGKKTGFLLSTRPYALTTFGELKTLEVLPFNAEQIEKFVRHYYGDLPNVDGLLKELKEVEEVRPLAENPFLLSIVASIYFRKGEIKTSILDLYEDVVKQLVVELDERNKKIKRFRIDDPDSEKKLDFLKELAFARFFEDASQNDEERLIFDHKYIKQKAVEFRSKLSIEDPYFFVKDIESTPLLQEVGSERYAFFHFTLQEYLAAERLAQHPKDQIKSFFCKGLFSPFLAETEVLPMALGLVKCPEELFAHLEGLPESMTLTNLQLRIRALSYVKRLDSKHLEVLWKDLEEIIFKRDPLKAILGEEILASLKRAQKDYRDFFVTRIAPYLKDKDSKVRHVAARALGEIGSDAAVGALIEALKDKYWEVRMVAAEALGKIGSEAAVGALIEVLKDEFSHVRMAVLWALKKINKRATKVFIKTLNSMHNKTSKKNDDFDVRKEISWLLRKLGSNREEDLIDALKYKDPLVRWRAVWVLGKMGDKWAEGPLIAALKDRNYRIRLQAIRTLGKIGGEEVVKSLIEILESPDFKIRGEAARALGEIGSKRAIGPLIQALKEGDSNVRETAAWALGKIGSDAAVGALIEVLKDEVLRVRKAAAEA